MERARPVGQSYIYVWADGVHLQARLEDEAQCILVVIGATPRRQEGAARSRQSISMAAAFWGTAAPTLRCQPDTRDHLVDFRKLCVSTVKPLIPNVNDPMLTFVINMFSGRSKLCAWITEPGHVAH